MRFHPAVLLLGGLIFLFSLPALAVQQSAGQSAIASAHPIATSAGFEIIAQGGNAFDAAVAVSAALAVVEPMGSGLGGGGFWLLHRASDGFQIMLDGREKAPAAATRTMYLDQQGQVIDGLSLNGALAAAIPGLPAALVHLAANYGNLPLRQSLQPAIRAAEEGFTVYPRYRRLLKFRQPHLNPASEEIFLTKSNEVPAIGTVIKQLDLAATLRRLAIGQRDGFYKGETAEKLLHSVSQAGGIWSQADLDAYQVVERKPVIGSYRGARIVSAALPSSGGIVLVEILNLLADFDLDQLSPVEQKQKVIEAMRLAYRDRAKYLGDSDFVQVDQARLTSMAHADRLRANIGNRATPSDFLSDLPVQEGQDTSHFSIIDHAGNRVSATLSINYPFGSGMVAAGTGVILNDEMDDFSASPGVENGYGLVGSSANAIEAGKRPLSSMTPTFVEKNDAVLVVGTPGGSRIISMVLIAVLDFLHDRGEITDWLARGRFHHQYYPDVVQYEADALSDLEQSELSAMGYVLKAHKSNYGNMQAVLLNILDGSLQAASDPRWLGRAEVRSDQANQPVEHLEMKKTGTTD
ncbi:MAG: gamma-glutamyltransferase [Gammaproteobacteria bacterium]|nr:gamma-glutamyltransferase [Gammaproteobacteria bacterium]MDX2487381.1 gamma-glutamyltransferase [Gammaproteobacteria bacterium]